jgi:preprotein translocase subunit SecE
MTQKPVTRTLNPARFIREVRQEMDKVTWPSRKETMVSTVMVLGLATIAATFFVLVDWIAGSLIRTIIGI